MQVMDKEVFEALEAMPMRPKVPHVPQLGKNKNWRDKKRAQGGHQTSIVFTPAAAAVLAGKTFVDGTEQNQSRYVSDAVYAYERPLSDRLEPEAREALAGVMGWWGIQDEAEAVSLALRWLDKHTRENNLQRVSV